MTRDQFIIEMKDVMQTEVELTFQTVLKELEEWDSLAIMGTIAFLDKNFGVKTNLSDYDKMTTIEDIALKAGL